MTEVLTGLSHRFESAVATSLEGVRGVSISRRCADLPELLSVAEAGIGDVAVVSSDLRGLDLSAVSRLRSSGLRVVGLHPVDDEEAERRLRQLSITVVLPVEASPHRFAEALVDDAGGSGLHSGPHSGLDPVLDELERSLLAESALPAGSPADDQSPTTARAGMPLPAAAPDARVRDGVVTRRAGSRDWAGAESASDHDGLDSAGAGEQPTSRIIAVWGPTGAPGRTTVATTLAAEIASRGVDVLLVDADTYGGCVGQSLGLLDEAPGLAAACRAAENGTLDLASLAGLAPVVTAGLRVLTGLPKAERWPELRAAALERVFEVTRSLARVVVVDCGFCLEDDEELSYDTAAPRRNEATLTSLSTADTVVAVGGADPVALQRFVRGLQELGTVPSPEPVPVVNRVRSSAVGSRPQERIAASLLRFAGLESVRFVPDEPVVADGALLAGRTVVEHAPDSRLRAAVADLADALAPFTASRTRSRSTRRWPRRAG